MAGIRFANAQAVDDEVPSVPTGEYFLLNDNRSNLFDSRTIGPIGRSAILAQPLLVYRLDRLPFHLPHLLR